jgi:DNA polymerase (family 10)
VREGLSVRPRSLLYAVQDVAEKIERHVRAMPGVTKVSAAGSVRRKQDTVGELNFLVTGEEAASIFKWFASFGSVLAAEPGDKDEGVFTLSSGLTVRLRWTAPEAWGASLILATGSPAHLRELEARPRKRQVRLLASTMSGMGIAGDNEEDAYAALGLPFIEPELREGRGEVAAGARGALPKLVEVADLRGDLHMHTTASDGADGIAEMAAAASRKGYEYIAITDHCQSTKSPEASRNKIFCGSIAKGSGHGQHSFACDRRAEWGGLRRFGPTNLRRGSVRCMATAAGCVGTKAGSYSAFAASVVNGALLMCATREACVEPGFTVW